MEDFKGIVEDAIINNTKHANYDRVIALAKTYQILATGTGYEDFLVMFKRREEDEDFAERIKITTENLSAVCAPVLTQFGRLGGLQNIRKGIAYNGNGSEAVQAKIQDGINGFYANGLEYFLSTTYDRTALLDPNAFLVVEFRADVTKTQLKPYGIVFTSNEAINFHYDENEVLRYLLVKITVATKTTEGKKLECADYVLYAGEQAIKYTLYKQGDQIRQGIDPNGQQLFDDSKHSIYIVEEFAPMAQEVQAFRLGYIKDYLTKNKTCISPLHPAVEKFKDLIRTKSNFDLTKFLHTFPQKVQRQPACPGEDSMHTCNQGICPQTGNTCSKCNGTGRLSITQPTDAIVVTDDPSSDEMVKLESVIFYVKPEVQTFTLLRSEINDLTNEVYVAVFNSELTPHAKTTVQGATATEINIKREDINNTLLPFAEQKSTLYKFIVRQIASIVVDGLDVSKLLIHYEFPKDLKLSSITELYTDLKTATDSGAPAFVIEQIINDIAGKIYEGDDEALRRYQIKAKHIPFLGLSLDMIKYLDSKNYLRKEDIIRLAYQDSIFTDLERQNANFWKLPPTEQDGLITTYVQTIISGLPSDATVTINTNRRALLPTA